MKNILPKNKPDFILSEDIRAEPNNKAIILGMFLGNIVVTPIEEFKNEINHSLQSIAFSFGFEDGSGNFKSRVGLLDPNKVELIPNAKVQEIPKLETEPMFLFFKISPFPVREGIYTAWAELDGQKYERTFKVSMAES